MDILDQGMTPIDSDESFEKILRALMESKDIELKTEIPNPLGLAKLKALSVYLKAEKYKDSSGTINAFIEYFLKYMVSNKREGRKEIVQAISEGLKREKSIGEKLTTPP